MIEDEEELAEIDTSNIVYTGRRRNAPLDYSSEEALKQAGLASGNAAAEQEEDDAEFRVSSRYLSDLLSPSGVLNDLLVFASLCTHPSKQGEEMDEQ